MSITKYTQGPWKYDPRGFGKHTGSIVASDANETYTASIVSHQNASANARLIAAAPELLEALEALNHVCNFVLDVSSTHEGLRNVDALRLARNAIAKAKGGGG